MCDVLCVWSNVCVPNRHRRFMHISVKTIVFTLFLSLSLSLSHTHTPTHTATDDYIDIPEVNGCRVVTVTAVIYQATRGQPLQVLREADLEEATLGECPLDVRVDLMVGF